MAYNIALLFSGLFLMCGMLTGVWKYAKIMTSNDHQAPVYVDIAHRASFMYSFACLVMAQLISFSPFSSTLQLIITLVPIAYFTLAVGGYIKEGFLNKTDNMFKERNFITTWFMYSLIIGEIVGLAFIIGGFVYTQFIL